MTVAELDYKAQGLRAQGLTYGEIGERMGESKDQAWKRCNRERTREHVRSYKNRNRDALRVANREYNATHKDNCPSCGQPRARSSRGGPCAACRYDEYDRKARTVERLWAEGKSYPEIQAAMGWSKGALSVMMNCYRADGYDLPYRYRIANPRYPELVP